MPKIMIAAISSGSGKTSLTCGLLECYMQRGMQVSAIKCGPDYIDPMFHRQVLGVCSTNADPFFSDGDELRDIVALAMKGDILIMEGAMGIYDGISGMGKKGSCYEVARETDTPIILVVDAKGMGFTVMSLIKGILADDDAGLIRGIIFNRMSPAYFKRVKPDIEESLNGMVSNSSKGLPGEMPPHVRSAASRSPMDSSTSSKGLPKKCPPVLLGALPQLKNVTIKSRHLGLYTPGEIADIRGMISRLSEAISAHIDLDALLKIAEVEMPPHIRSEEMPPHIRSAASRSPIERTPAALGSLAANRSPVESSTSSKEPAREAPPYIRSGIALAVARDEAFCFYYDRNLKSFTDRGISLIPFSPIHDACLPHGVCGVLLGGGYPELFLKELSENESMRCSIRTAIEAGLPSLAECGGYMYLLDGIKDDSGKEWPMASVVHGYAENTGSLVRFGYASYTGNSGFAKGLTIRGHEFHYYEATLNCSHEETTVIPGTPKADRTPAEKPTSTNGSPYGFVAQKPGRTKQKACMIAGETNLWGFPHLYYPSCGELVDRFISKMEDYYEKYFVTDTKNVNTIHASEELKKSNTSPTAPAG